MRFPAMLQECAKRYPRFALLCLYTLLLLPLYAPLLSGWQIYAVGDSLGFNAPALRALRSFSLSSLLADPLVGQGFPWIVTYGTLDPVAHVLRLFFDEFQTLAWLCFLSFLFGTWMFSLFLLKRGRSFGASLAGGLLFLGSFFWVGDGDYPLAFSLPLLASLLLTLSSRAGRPLVTAGLLAMATGYGWLAGHFNYVPLCLVGAAVFLGFDEWHERGWRGIPHAFLLFVAGTGAGTVLGLLKLVPALAYVQLSERAGGLSAEAASTTVLHLSSLSTVLFPTLRLPLLPSETGGLFYGAAGLALLLLASFAWRQFHPSLLACVLILIIALPHSPLYWLLQHLPFFSFLRSPTRWLFLGHACVAAAASGAFDAVVSGSLPHPRRHVGTVLLAAGLAACAVALLLLLIDLAARDALLAAAKRFFEARFYAGTSGLPLAHYHRYIERVWDQLLSSFSLLSPRFVIPLLALLVTGYAFRASSLWTGHHRRSSALLAGLVVFSSFLPLFFHHPKARRFHVEQVATLFRTQGIHRKTVMPVMPGLADFMLRTTVVGDRTDERLPYTLGLLIPNTHALLGIRSIDFYQPLQPTRMSRMLALLGSDNAPAPADEQLAHLRLTLAEKLSVFAGRVPLMTLLGVDTLLSAWELPSPFVQIASIKPVDRLPPIRLYRVPDARPIAYAPRKIERMAPDENAVVARLRDLADPSVSFIECVACESQAASSLHVIDQLHQPLFSSLSVDASGLSWLIVQRPRIPGWRASIDGKPLRTAIANGLFFGMPIPQGRHDVRLEISYRTLFADSLRMLMTGEDPWLL